METAATHTGRGATLRRAAAVPDLLASWRADPGLVLGRPEYAGATILIASPDFAACPARELAVTGRVPAGQVPAGQAVTQRPAAGEAAADRAAASQDVARRAASALASHGFLVLASAGFDEIFCHNMTKSGVHPLCLSAGEISVLQDIVDADPATSFTVDFGNREMTAGDKFSAVFEIVSSARRQRQDSRADVSGAIRRGGEIAECAEGHPALLQAAGPATLAGRIRAAQHRIACLDVPADVRIHLQHRLVAVCDAMKSATADPARCERRLAALAAELDRLTAVPGPRARPDRIS